MPTNFKSLTTEPNSWFDPPSIGQALIPLVTTEPKAGFGPRDFSLPSLARHSSTWQLRIFSTKPLRTNQPSCSVVPSSGSVCLTVPTGFTHNRENNNSHREKTLAPLSWSKHIIHPRQRILTLLRPLIESSEANTQLQQSISLGCEQSSRTPIRPAFPNQAFFYRSTICFSNSPFSLLAMGINGNHSPPQRLQQILQHQVWRSLVLEKHREYRKFTNRAQKLNSIPST